MKKLLSLLATVSLVSTTTASIVACGSGENIKQDISTIVSVTDLGDINFYSLIGNDAKTQTEIINQVKTLNPNAGDEQINISNINRARGTATISVIGFNGSLTVTFTVVPEPVPEPEPISFPSSIWSTIQLQDGTILVAGGTTARNSFLATVDLSNLDGDSQVQILAQGSGSFPSVPRSIIKLKDSTILIVGGNINNGSDAFLATVDLSNPDDDLQIQILAQGPAVFPTMPNSIVQFQDDMFLVAGGLAANGSDSFLASVDLSNPDNPQIQTLAQGPTAFPSLPESMIQLQDGTFLVAGGNIADGSDAFLASVDLSNSQVQILAQSSTLFPSVPRSIIQLQDGTIFVVGGNTGSTFLASADLSDPANLQTQILAQGSDAYPSAPRSIIQLQDGTILVAGGVNAQTSFLIRY